MPGQPVVLDSLGGLVASARPEDIPEGASPRTYDTNFIIGRFIQRAGLQSLYSYSGATFGPNGGGAVADLDTQNNPWASPGNILANDGTFTANPLAGAISPSPQTASVSATAPGSQSAFLGSIPSVVCTSVTVFVVINGSFSGGTGQVNLEYAYSGGFLSIAQFWNSDFSATVPISIPGSVDISTIQIQVFVSATAGGPIAASITACTIQSPDIPLISDQLSLTQFGFTVPSTSSILGIAVNVKGFAPNSTLFAQMLKGGTAVGNTYSIALPTSNAFVMLGGPIDTWGEMWDFTAIDATGFGVLLWVVAGSAQTVSLDYCDILIYGSASSSNFLGLMDANLDATDLVTLALDATGLVWEEDVTNAPNVLARASLIPAVVPGSYMKGVDANGVAYMAYSDLTQGTSQPMQYTGQWCDRITQVGPGQAPVFTPQQASSDTFNISTITQPAQQVRTSSYFLQSQGAGNTAAGSNVTIYYSDSTLSGPDTLLEAAFNAGNAVYLYMTFAGSGIPTQGPYVVQVTSVGLAQPPGQPRAFYYFTYTLPTSAFQYYQGSGHPSYTVTYQQSVATLTTALPVPGLDVNSSIVVSGVTPSSWDGTWVITQTLNSGAVTITQTAATSGVVTYNYTLINGVAPAAGQYVSITNTLNDDGLLNGASLFIATATGGSSGSFTVNLSVPDATAVSESAQGVTAGTIFAFDPGAADVGTSTNPIFGSGTGGALTFSAATATFITPGVKQGSAFWITRNGAVSFPANPVTFTVPNNTSAIAATQVLIGPPNVVARGIIFTESGQNQVPGANFYTYDTAVTFTVNGIQYTATALIINDNVSTSATFSFPDSVLLASDEIDVPGHNYFNLREIGSPTWMKQYANRMQYGLCQTKLDDFVNLTFDGGYIPAAFPQPAWWTPIAPPTGVTVGLVVSPDFGDCLQILNTSGSTVTNAFLYYQTAYQDFYNVPILQPNTAYSVRFKARALNTDGQQVTLALAPFSSGAFGVPKGSVTFTVNQGGFTIQTVEILTPQVTIDPTLQLAIEIASIANEAGVQIDRIEFFPTNHPIDTTTIWESYVGAFESVDRVSGQLGCGDDNNQPAQGSYQILEQLYIEKTASRCVTQDSPNYEPDQWSVPLASQGVGAVGPNAFHSEEEFSISVSRSGIFLFDGGKPMPISRELQSTGVNASLWEKINWNAAKTIWCRYSTNLRELYIGVPMNTPNFWLPNAPAATPTSPNVVIMCNFTGCPTAAELAESAPVHTTMFGDLKALDMRRKWSLWNMSIPAAEFITRGDGVSEPLFLCNGINSSKIYQLVNGAASGGQNTDDGAPINWLYTTYAFVKAKQGQQIPGLGALRKVWYYFAATVEGVGQYAKKFYSNTLGALTQNTYTAPVATLSYPAQNDQECVLEIGGQRLFVEFSAVGTGGYAEIGPVMLDGEMDKNAPHRGVSA